MKEEPNVHRSHHSDIFCEKKCPRG